MQKTNKNTKKYLKYSATIYYPVNDFFSDESKAFHFKNYKMWNQIQPEIQAIADQVITEMEPVNLVIQQIKENNLYNDDDVYEKRISDAIYAIFSVGKNYFQEWIDRCDKELDFEYSGELFCCETETKKLGWVSFSKFLDIYILESYFNACLLLYAMELSTMNSKNIEIVRSIYGNIPEFKSSIREKFIIMDHYHTFQHRWKGSEYYTKAILV